MATQPIPEPLYRQILDRMPIVCVDVVVLHEGRVLLVKRATEPAKGDWWFPGGRLLKGELLAAAAVRKCREEIGLDVAVVRRLGTWETTFPRAPFPEITSGVHSVNVCFLVRPLDETVRLDETSEEHRWIDRLEDGLPSYVHEVVHAAAIWPR